jgi:hypothetical protein
VFKEVENDIEVLFEEGFEPSGRYVAIMKVRFE